MKKIITKKAANAAAETVANYIKSTFKDRVEATEILIYWEDGRYNINVRAYFKKGKEISNREDYQIMKEMQYAGMLDCEAVLLQEDDGYKTYVGFSNWCDKEPDTSLKQVRNLFKRYTFSEDITARIAVKNEPYPILYLQSNKKGLGPAIISVRENLKGFRRYLNGYAKLTESWFRSTDCLPKVQQTCTFAYKITLV